MSAKTSPRSPPAQSPSGPASRDDLTISQIELIERISWLIRLRWFAFCAVLATLAAAKAILGSQLPWGRLVLTAFAIPLLNLACYATWKREQSISEDLERSSLRIANAQIVYDLVILGVLIHFSGGLENPFVFYFIFHVAIASILLSARLVYTHATLAVMVVTGIALGEKYGILAHYCLLTGEQARTLYSNGTYVFSAICAFATTLYVTAWLATTIAANLRYREDQVAELSTQSRRDADSLRVAFHRLSEIDKAKSAYARRVSHELRSPLAAIDALLRAVTEGLHGDIPEKTRDMIERARNRTQGMLVLVHDLLTLAASREARELRKVIEIDLRSTLHDVMRLLAPVAAARGVKVNTTVSDDIPLIDADQEGMEELLTNLISNAVKYSFEKGVVHVCLRRSAGFVEIEVRDSGIGIAPDDKEKIFNEFYRAGNARDFAGEGTGLGLSIVRSIAEAHGGSVTAQSEVQAGTTFTVRLPLSEGEVEPAPEEARPDPPL